MSDAETGVYITLIARMYEMAGPIERDDRRLSRLCGCKSVPSFKKHLSYLIGEGKIIETDGELFNERVEKEIKKTTEKSSKAKAAAESRWGKKLNKINGRSNADALRTHSPSICQSEPESEPYKRVANATPKVASKIPFSQFWEKWPNKVAKANAEKAWKKLSVEDQHKIISLPECGFRAWRSRVNPDTSPIHPASFLNGRRWEDSPIGRSDNRRGQQTSLGFIPEIE